MPQMFCGTVKIAADQWFTGLLSDNRCIMQCSIVVNTQVLAPKPMDNRCWLMILLLALKKLEKYVVRWFAIDLLGSFGGGM